jgi:hypothetical protein
MMRRRPAVIPPPSVARAPRGLVLLAAMLVGLAGAVAPSGGAWGQDILRGPGSVEDFGSRLPGWSGRGAAEDQQRITGPGACETIFRRCIVTCPAGDVSGPCASGCYQNRAQCVMNPSRTTARPR